MGHLNFTETVELLDQLKQQWYLLKYITERHSKFGDRAATARLALDELDRNIAAITTLMKSSANAYVKEDQLKGYLSFDGLVYQCKQEQLQRTTSSILKGHTDGYPFYADAGYGLYWNEVPLPCCIEQLFTTFVELTKWQYPGMLGVEHPNMALPDNAAALSIYDLSNIAVIFESETCLEEFLKENSVEPSDIMYWTGSCWQC